MGVKSTVTLTREAAEERYVDLFAKINAKDLKRQARVLSDKELEVILMQWNDVAAGGEGFENYRIQGDD